jgi:glycosyltransferase involved in cell wall biosynthesis
MDEVASLAIRSAWSRIAQQRGNPPASSRSAISASYRMIQRKSMPAISVIIPAFNCAAYLPEAIESVLAQSLSDFEIIVVDDGSLDNTCEIVHSLLDDRIRYIYQENSGLPAARNTGVQQARGEYIAALDSDDLLAPTALDVMLSALKESRASWCITNVLKFWEKHQEIRRTEMPAGNLLHAILREDFIRRAMFIEKAALQRVGMWNPLMKMREDWDLNIRLIEAREPYCYVDKPLYLYRKRPDSITTGNPKRLLYYTKQVLREHHKKLADAGDPVAAKLYAQNMWDLGRQHFYRRGDMVNLVRCMTESLAYDRSLSRLFRLSLPGVFSRLRTRNSAF